MDPDVRARDARLAWLLAKHKDDIGNMLAGMVVAQSTGDLAHEERLFQMLGQSVARLRAKVAAICSEYASIDQRERDQERSKSIRGTGKNTPIVFTDECCFFSPHVFTAILRVGLDGEPYIEQPSREKSADAREHGPLHDSTRLAPNEDDPENIELVD